jgi:nucleotide sugar dehydrogenase
MSVDHACVIGLGYVGLPLAVALTEAGLRVTGLDSSERRVAQLRAGRSGIEDISDELLSSVLAGGLIVTTDPAEAADATTYVICVPTPLRESFPDLASVESAAGAVAGLLRRGDLVILESTTYPGTTEEVVAPILESISGLAAGTDFHLAYSPERIDPGNQTYGLTNTPKVVGGCTTEAGDRAEEFYLRVVDTVVRVSGTREAELAKLIENTFRHVNIALVNEMAIFSRELGIDLWESIRAASTKPFGFMPFYPGPGVGGHCIPVDPSYLSYRVRKLGYPFRFVELAQEVNNRMPSYVLTRAAHVLNIEAGKSLSRSRVLCIGAAYKPGISDCRESPSLEVMRLLRERQADVVYHDELVSRLDLGGDVLDSVPLNEAELRKADLVVLLTVHPGVDLEAIVSNATLVLDTRNVVDRAMGHVHAL